MVRQLLSTTNQPTTNSNVFSTVFDHWKDYDIDTRWKICGVRLPRFPRFRYLGIYVSGGLFALGWWAFIDAIIYAKITQISHSIIVQDWISGVLSTLGMIIVNSINKKCLTETVHLYSGSNVNLWKARLALFMGFVLMASGVCWSATNFVLNYLLPKMPMQIWYFGLTMLIQNLAIMLSTIVLWLSSTIDNNYKPVYLL